MARVCIALRLSSTVSCFLLFCLVSGSQDASTDLSSRAEVTSLPGFDGVLPSRHHAGYLTVDFTLRSHLYYYFVESENDPQRDPVVLWLNGGPGCSSFDGFVYEHGPFNFDFNGGDIRLEINPYAWSKVASKIFLDSPAGVGLSYSEGVKHYETDDEKTATDLHAAVLKFLELFPEFSPNRFFVAGESYAGIYVPLLVHEIVKGNEAETGRHVNLVGYLVGNGCTDPYYDGQAFPPFAVGKSLISLNFYTEIFEACLGLFWRQPPGSKCAALQWRAYALLLSKNLNLYDVAGKCELPPEGVENRGAQDVRRHINAFIQENGWVWPMGPVPAAGRVHNWKSAINMEPPCCDYWTCETWFNRADVREAIHAASIDVAGKFLLCEDSLSYNKTVESVLHLHHELIKSKGLHALIFSGDHDMAVPHIGTELWTVELDFEVVSEWDSWIDRDGQVAGYYVEYEGLTYCTVRNAGHMVPQTHPVQALEMFRRYITHLSMTPPAPTVGTTRVEF